MNAGPATSRALIDLDHNATTALDPRVLEAMLPALRLGNPSSVHARGRAARDLLDGARREVAAILGCEPGEVVFTASGSEADALGLKGAFLANRGRSARVLVSAVEHPAILESAKHLVALGAEVLPLPVDANGVVQLDALPQLLAPGAAVVAAMWANNETGAIQPVTAIARLAHEAGALFLCDAVQAAGKLRLGAEARLPDLLAISAHKLHGPTGSGALVVRRGLALWPLVGGHQERGRRGGTENVAGAVGLARALAIAQDGLERDLPHLSALRGRFEHAVQAAFPEARIHARGAPRVANTSAICFPGCDGEALLIGLDLEGVCASLGAACASGSVSPSHVLLAMGVSAEDAKGSLRFSFGRDNLEGDVDRVVAILRRLVPAARRGAT